MFYSSRIANLFFIAICVFLSVFFLQKNEVYAQTSSGLKVQPAFIEEAINPGDTYKEIFKITNLSNEEQTYYLSVKNIKGLSGNNNVPLFAEEGEVTGLEVASWVLLSRDVVVVGPKDEVEVPFTIVVPNDATPGSHVGGIFAGLRPPRLRETGTGVGYQVGTILSLKITGDVLEDARIREFSSDKNIYSSPNATFSLTVQNEGNILVRPQGFVEVTNMFGERVAQLTVNESGGAVLPKSDRVFSVAWDGGSLSFGRYQVHAGLVFGEFAKQNIESSLFIWVLPMKIILPFLIGLLFVVLAIYIAVRIHIRRKLVVAQRTHVKMVHDEAPLSKLTLIAVVVILFTVFFFSAVFLFFA